MQSEKSCDSFPTTRGHFSLTLELKGMQGEGRTLIV